MRRIVFALCAIAAAGCGGRSAPSMDLTNGVVVATPGCSYTFTTPAQTTPPTMDDGFVSKMGAPSNVHLTWVGDPTTTMVVTWETDFDTTGTIVNLVKPDGSLATVRGFSFAYPTDLAGSDPPSVRIHQVHLCGLVPGARYSYAAGAGVELTSVASFSTLPSAPQTLRVLMVGDSRGNDPEFGKVFNLGASEQPDFAIFTGDANDLGTIQDQWESWLKAAAPSLPSLPMYFAEGNHEINARHFFAQFPLPRNQQWFDFDAGPAHFVVLNDTPMDPSVITGDEATFLQQSLSSTQQKWKIVVHHQPPYTSSLGHPPDTMLQMAWSPIYDANGVDFVMNGHAHAYERSYPIKAGQNVADGKGPVYVVEGGAGADPYDVSPQSFTAFAQKTFGYALLDFAGSTVKLTAKDDAGNLIDQYQLTK